MRVTILVLGDVGRSPRMQYHALALAHAAVDVDVVGYAGSTIHPTIRDHERIAWHFLRRADRSTASSKGRIAFLLSAAAKVVSECAQLARLLLFRVSRPDVVLVQNPPAIPTLLIAWLAARLRSARLVVDWHNFGYSMLALRLGTGHPLVTMARWYERCIGRLADAHLCVSKSMQGALLGDMGIAGAIVLYDKPADFFRPTPRATRDALLRRLVQDRSLPASLLDDEENTAGRPALIVSATSWSADEDFAVLLDAARACDHLIAARDASGQSFPTLVICVTGRGPRRAEFQAQVAGLALRHVSIHTLWLEPEDYPLLLGAADLGVCLHRSASGHDLPMKIADMFGSGLPVCALDYGPCLEEQLQHGTTGLLFTTGVQLAEQIYRLFEHVPDESRELDELRRNVIAHAHERWEREWTTCASRLFTA